MHPDLAPLFDNIRQVIVGKDDVIRSVLTALLARGHVLIEDAPGLGKTMLARALAQSLHCTFKRIQLTPDLLPTDVTGVSIYHPHHERFEFIPGPVFTQVLLADELNRTSPRTQSSLLEAMEEQQVTVEGKTMPLDELFFVMATQNPIELEGTFPLPEAQIDRFLMRIELGYPAPEEETEILARQVTSHPVDDLKPVMEAGDIVAIQDRVRQVHVAAEIRSYIVALAGSTRQHPDVRIGISPRGSLALMHAAQACAFLDGDSYVSPDVVKTVAPAVLCHRLLLDPHREYAGLSRTEIIERTIEVTPVPTLPHGARTT